MENNRKHFINLMLWVLMIPVLSSCSYNRMVELDESVTAQWAQVENAYQRRADLIPNLVSTVKGYADFEQETLTQVIEARSRATGVTVNSENLHGDFAPKRCLTAVGVEPAVLQ